MGCKFIECNKPLQVTEFLVSSLVESGAIEAAGLAEAVEAVDRLGLDPGSGLQPIGPRIVARAWTDPGFKGRLLHDATAAVAELGISASNSTASTKLTVVENTAEVHNVVVCTLCSCYPIAILGLSPAWYKSRTYRELRVHDIFEGIKLF